MAPRTPAALLMASTCPNEDLDLLRGDYAAIRPSTRLERKRMGVRWPRKAFTVVLRSCAGIQAIVFPASRAVTAEKVDQTIASSGIPRGVAVLAFALRISPPVEAMLRDERPSAGPCHGCNCMWKGGGGLDPGSTDSVMVRTLIRNSEERIAA